MYEVNNSTQCSLCLARELHARAAVALAECAAAAHAWEGKEEDEEGWGGGEGGKGGGRRMSLLGGGRWRRLSVRWMPLVYEALSY